MKKSLVLFALLGIMLVVFWPQSAQKERPNDLSSATSGVEVTPDPIRATSTKLPDPQERMLNVPAPQPQEPQEPQERIVHLSSTERREGEADLAFKLRTSWLNSFHSFAQRAYMSQPQYEQLVSVLADAQEEAVIAWEMYEEWPIDPFDIDSAPSLVTLSNTMEDDLLATLRTFLTHKQMVAFRRTPTLKDPFGSGLLLPLTITREPMPDASSVN